MFKCFIYLIIILNKFLTILNIIQSIIKEMMNMEVVQKTELE